MADTRVKDGEPRILKVAEALCAKLVHRASKVAVSICKNSWRSAN